MQSLNHGLQLIQACVVRAYYQILHGAFLHDSDVLPRILNVPIGRLSKLCFPKGFSVYQDLFWNAQVLDRQALLSHQLSGSLQKGISAERTGFPTDVRCKEFEASPLEPLFARVVLDDNEWGSTNHASASRFLY